MQRHQDLEERERQREREREWERFKAENYERYVVFKKKDFQRSVLRHNNLTTTSKNNKEQNETQDEYVTDGSSFQWTKPQKRGECNVFYQ